MSNLASSILTSLDMSLDDLINERKTSKGKDARPAGKRQPNASANPNARNRNNNDGGAGPVRGGRAGRMRNRRRNQPYQRSRNDDAEMDIEMDGTEEDRGAAADTGSKGRRGVVVKRQPGGRGGGAKKGSILSRLGNKATEKDTPSVGTKILVKNLKYDILEDDVRELFSTVGEVTKAEIVYDRSGRSKGIARVWFAKRSDAEKSIKQYDGRTLDGQPMQITLDSDTNVRKGLFGTALTNRRDNEDNVNFKVSFSNEERPRGGRGGRGPRGRGGRGGSGPKKTSEELDSEMDTYMKDDE